jgi:hypothetical protein
MTSLAAKPQPASQKLPWRTQANPFGRHAEPPSGLRALRPRLARESRVCAALVFGCLAACDAFVVDTSTRRASRVQRLVDHGIEPLAISETELFVADFSKERRGSAEFERVIRYDLGQLPQIATQL